MKKYKVPLGFARIDEGLYRSAYPAGKTFPFLETLQLKSIISLSPHDVRDELTEFASSKSIQLYRYDIKHNQDPFLTMTVDAISEILEIMLDPVNQPVLLFCTNGKVRTSCVVGCLRKCLGWSMSSIVAEFEQFADPEGGLCDLQFIDAFDLKRILHGNTT